MHIDFFKDDSEFRICEINDPFHKPYIRPKFILLLNIQTGALGQKLS